MTTAILYRNEDAQEIGIVADMLILHGTQGRRSFGEKMWEVMHPGGSFVMAYAGIGAGRIPLEVFSRQYEPEVTDEQSLWEFTRDLRTYLLDECDVKSDDDNTLWPNYGFEFLFGNRHICARVSENFDIEPINDQSGFLAIGTGAKYAMGALHSRRYQVTVQLATEAIEIAAAYDSATGKDAGVCAIQV